MARDYLTIPGMLCSSNQHQVQISKECAATSVDVERIFSTGRHLLPYSRNRLSAQSTRALICLHHWSKSGLVKDSDVLPISKMVDLAEDTDDEQTVADGWDNVRSGLSEKRAKEGS